MTTNFSSPRSTSWLNISELGKFCLISRTLPYFSVLFFEASCFSESFVRGGKRKETCQEQSSDSSPISFNHRRIMCTETHLQNIPQPLAILFKQFILVICLSSALKNENRKCVSMTQRSSNKFSLTMKKIFSKAVIVSLTRSFQWLHKLAGPLACRWQ